MFLQKTALMMLVTVLLVQQAHGKSEKDGDAFSSWFGHMSAAGPVLHFNDEGSPYRFALGVGHPVFLNELSFIATAAYSYYDVNAVADNNPSLNVKGGNSHSLGLDLLLRWSFLQTPHASYHFEGGAGFQYMLTDPPFPADGSNENFTLFSARVFLFQRV